MFHFDRGLKLTSIDLAIDMRRRQPRGFISHAHMDHMAPHEIAFCTPATARLYQHRLGDRRRTWELPFREPLELDGARLTTFPAGHCLGSAMLLAEIDGESLLYTGDFKLGRSATAEEAELPQADILVMESTFGDPAYRLPPREEVVEALVTLVQRTLALHATPVIHAYVLGKSQEVTRILTDAGIPVLHHPAVYEVSRVYEECGCPLGDYRLYPGYAVPGHAVVTPPLWQKGARLPRLGRTVTIAVTGWAADPAARHRLGTDHALPLSDHADYDELLAAIEQVQPRVIYCTHGPEAFVDHLQDAGYDARCLHRREQLRLF